MATGTLVVRTTKNVFFKSKRYTVNVSGQEERNVNYEQHKTVYELPIGKHTVQIGNGKSVSTQEITLGAGQQKTLTINPSVTYGLGLGFLLGIALTSVVIQYVILNRISLPLAFIPFIPLLFLRKRQFADSFVVTATTS